VKARILAALVGLGLILPAILWGGQIAVEVVVALAMLVGIDEWTRMATPDDRGRTLPALGIAGLGVFAQLTWGAPAWHLPALAAGSLGMLLTGLLLVPDTDRGAIVAGRLVAGLVYVCVLLAFLPWVRRFDDGVTWIVLILAVTWMSDTGAYFAGRAFGRRKLFERVSPKKTWEGAIGGAVAAVAAALVVKAVGLPQVGWGHAVALGLLLDFFGVVGDLTESMFKRSFDVKDSGWIMPGHGGILDRVDSLLFTAPVAWIYASAFGLG
jgi:phosphatidate cytidylyltransferase